jgi:hypothetical protein
MFDRANRTDFKEIALDPSPLGVAGKTLMVTVDFEGFRPSLLDSWLLAMRRWASHSATAGLRSCIFIALEDVARLRYAQPDRYDDFLEAVTMLHESGAAFYPHNHGVFDSATGMQADYRPERVSGYSKRASFFYDVVHRHRLNLTDWLRALLGHYQTFLTTAGISQPTLLAFRAGGWDHGATLTERVQYVKALSDAGVRYDSSVSRGEFGTRGFRVGAPFGRNVFALTKSLIEVAPCGSVNCGAEPVSLSSLRSLSQILAQPQVWALRERDGAFVIVSHFDHLFRVHGKIVDDMDRATVVRRLDRFFRVLSSMRTLLNFSSVSTFEDLVVLPNASGRGPLPSETPDIG